MDPYKFNSWIRILVSFCSLGLYIIMVLMVPVFVADSDGYKTTYGILYVNPFNTNKYIGWAKFSDALCENANEIQLAKIAKYFKKSKRPVLCNSIQFFRYYFLLIFIISTLNIVIVMCAMIYTHFRQHPEIDALKHIRFCNQLIIMVICIIITNVLLLLCSLFFFNTKYEFGLSDYIHTGFYIIIFTFLLHLLVILFLKRDKTTLKCICELEVLPWQEEIKKMPYNSEQHDTLISPYELVDYLRHIFQTDDIRDEQLQAYFGTTNYETIYFIILENIKMQKLMMNSY
ncbi:conserved protein, unknown function [Hepatocystis sp. ex Piliocolobus tephrosceles]|nr:conserved protein, unknown function [Hepatocystis sp. ex Piliocolobus tephrosceles]